MPPPTTGTAQCGAFRVILSGEAVHRFSTSICSDSDFFHGWRAGTWSLQGILISGACQADTSRCTDARLLNHRGWRRVSHLAPYHLSDFLKKYNVVMFVKNRRITHPALIRNTCDLT